MTTEQKNAALLAFCLKHDIRDMLLGVELREVLFAYRKILRGVWKQPSVREPILHYLPAESARVIEDMKKHPAEGEIT